MLSPVREAKILKIYKFSSVYQKKLPNRYRRGDITPTRTHSSVIERVCKHGAKFDIVQVVHIPVVVYHPADSAYDAHNVIINYYLRNNIINFHAALFCLGAERR